MLRELRRNSPDRSNRSPEQLRESVAYLGALSGALNQPMQQRPDRRGERGSSPLHSLVADQDRRRRRDGAATGRDGRDQTPAFGASARGQAAARAAAGPPAGAPPPRANQQQQQHQQQRQQSGQLG